MSTMIAEKTTTNTITVKDGTTIYYKDWGNGQPVVFSHGWPLNADAWDAQMIYLGQRGFRVIAHDRRGHGRSSQPSNGNDMDTYADDLAKLIEALDLKKITMVCQDWGGLLGLRILAEQPERFARLVFGHAGSEENRLAQFLLAEVPVAAVRQHLLRREPPPEVVDRLIRVTYRAVTADYRARKTRTCVPTG